VAQGSYRSRKNDRATMEAILKAKLAEMLEMLLRRHDD
jgi:hypothetical protein